MSVVIQFKPKTEACQPSKSFDPFVSLKASLVREIGFEAAGVYEYLKFLTNNPNAKDSKGGWVQVTKQEWRSRWGIKRKPLDSAIRLLVRRGLIEYSVVREGRVSLGRCRLLAAQNGHPRVSKTDSHGCPKRAALKEIKKEDEIKETAPQAFSLEEKLIPEQESSTDPGESEMLKTKGKKEHPEKYAPESSWQDNVDKAKSLTGGVVKKNPGIALLGAFNQAASLHHPKAVTLGPTPKHLAMAKKLYSTIGGKEDAIQVMTWVIENWKHAVAYLNVHYGVETKPTTPHLEYIQKHIEGLVMAYQDGKGPLSTTLHASADPIPPSEPKTQMTEKEKYAKFWADKEAKKAAQEAEQKAKAANLDMSWLPNYKEAIHD